MPSKMGKQARIKKKLKEYQPHQWRAEVPQPARPEWEAFLKRFPDLASQLLGGPEEPLQVGVVVYDVEALHTAAKGAKECKPSEEVDWKSQSQIVQFGAVDLLRLQVLNATCRPEFAWDQVVSPNMQKFAEENHLDKIAQAKDEDLGFASVWHAQILPFLLGAAGDSQRLALIAHNGDNFDHPVLVKELARLGLLPLPVQLIFLDPLSAKKRAEGLTYVPDMELSKMYARMGEDAAALVTSQEHDALGDCAKLVAVLGGSTSESAGLRQLLAGELRQHLLTQVQAV